MMSEVRWRILACVALLFAISACGGGNSAAGSADSAEELQRARQQANLAACPPSGGTVARDPALPDLTFPCLSGGPDVSLRRLTGQPTVLNLWATWCVPCRAELPEFQQVHEETAERVRVIGVVVEDPDPIRPLSFAADFGIRFPSLVDDQGSLRKALGVPGLPSTIFVSAKGEVVDVYSGPPLSAQQLRQLIADHLQIDLNG